MTREELIRATPGAVLGRRAEASCPRSRTALGLKGLEQHTSLREALTDTALPAENKKAVIAELVGDRANPVTVTLLGFVVDAGRARELPKIVEHLAQVAAGERDHALAEVRSAVELTKRNATASPGALASHRPFGRREGRRRPFGGRGIVARVGDGSSTGRCRSSSHPRSNT
jgi:F-type H+-transporting ATPase subunit delta